MKTKTALIASLLMAGYLSACSGGGDAAPASSKLAADPAPVSNPSPSPTPSASPSPAPYAYSGGTGTSADPYILAVAEDVNRIRDNPSAVYSMNQSISLSSITWVPIPSFTGTIRGNGFELDNLTVTKSDGSAAAFILDFGSAGVITDVSFYGVNVSTSGAAAILCITMNGRLTLSEFTGTITSGTGGSGYAAGGARPVYVSKSGSAQFVSNTQDVYYNTNHITGVVN